MGTAIYRGFGSIIALALIFSGCDFKATSAGVRQKDNFFAAINSVPSPTSSTSPAPVSQAPANLTYSSLAPVFTQGIAITPLSPTSQGGTPTNYSISPPLPAGLNLSSVTGIISGTPSAAASATNFVVTASNTGGSTNKILSITITAAPAPSPTPSPLGNVYYFSTTDGDDNRTPTQAKNSATPWKTISKLNSFFPSLQPGDSVYFKNGDIFEGPITVSKSGTPSLPITLASYGSGNKAKIQGFKAIINWTSVGNGIYESDAQSVTPSVNLVTLNGSLQPMGRWPKANAINGGYLNYSSHTLNTSLSSVQLNGAPNFLGGEVVTRPYRWLLNRGLVTGQTSNAITYNPFPTPIGSFYDGDDGHGFFFQNHVNTLTELGDWAYDKNTKKLKMYFGTNAPSAYSVKISSIETLVDSTSRSYVTFRNLAFSGSNSVTLDVSSANHILIDGCEISFSGTNGVFASASTHHIRIINSKITTSLNNAIDGRISSDWEIQDNEIVDTGMIKGMGVSGDGQYNAIAYISSNSVITHNTLKNVGYIGIHFKGANVTIQNNFVDGFCLSKDDGGAIYTWNDSSTNRKIIGNIVINGSGDSTGTPAGAEPGQAYGIYIDGGAKNVEITGNTVANSQSGIHLNSAQNLLITGNTFFNNTATQYDINASIEPGMTIQNLTLQDNIFFAKSGSQFLGVATSASNDLSQWGSLAQNYYCRPAWEPQGIDTPGAYFNSISGGVFQANLGSGRRDYSLDTWKNLTGQETGSIKTPVPVPNATSIRFEYNSTLTNKVIPLSGNYQDVRGNLYLGTITLLPFRSVILLPY